MVGDPGTLDNLIQTRRDGLRERLADGRLEFQEDA